MDVNDESAIMPEPKSATMIERMAENVDPVKRKAFMDSFKGKKDKPTPEADAMKRRMYSGS